MVKKKALIKRKLLQFWVLERQYDVVRDVIERANEVYRREEAKYSFTIGDTLSLIVREWGKERKYINGDGTTMEAMELVRNNPDERAYFETIISSVEKGPSAGNARELGKLVQKMNPEYRITSSKELLIEAKRLLEAV